MSVQASSTFWQRPGTKLGWWAVGLAVAFVVMYVFSAAVIWRLHTNTPWQMAVLPIYGILMLLCGLASGIVGLIALIRKHERSWVLWLTILPGAMMLFLLLGEFLVPH
jgi:hypothetical protein